MIITERTFFFIKNVAAALVFATSTASALAGDFYEKEGLTAKPKISAKNSAEATLSFVGTMV
ncbi:MAG: hypothetical protein ACREQ7_08605 [Candidatus Binatia bacterium]